MSMQAERRSTSGGDVVLTPGPDAGASVAPHHQYSSGPRSPTSPTPFGGPRAGSPKGGAGGYSSLRRYKFFRRLVHVRQMDFEFALWQMLYLCMSPSRVYRNFRYNKGTKNQWARDDPAFLVLLSLWLFVSSIGVAVVFGLGFTKFVSVFLWVVFVDCIGVGLVIGSLLWFVSNKYLKEQYHAHSVDQNVELAYAFDVHCNAFFPLLIILHVLQLFFVKLVLRPWFISVVFADTLWLIAISYYIYITFLGYKALPFLKNPVIFLYPIAAVAGIWLLAVLSHWNISQTVFKFYGYL